MADSPAPRRARRALAALLFLPVLAACSTPLTGTAATSTAAATSTTVDSGSTVEGVSSVVPAAAAGSAAAAAPTVDTAALLAAVDTAAGSGSIEVVVLDATGTELVAGADADTPIATASLVKLFVVQQLLAADGTGTVTLDDDDLALMRRAVTASDDDAMNTLWTRFDGAALVTAAAEEFGLTGTAAPEVAGQWGETTTTAADYATFLAGLPGSLDDADLATLTGWMESTTATAADGFDQQFGLLSADAADATGTVAAKQGWMCCVDSRRQLHSAGVLADGRVVVLLGAFPTSTSWAQAQEALDAAAEAVVTATA